MKNIYKNCELCPRRCGVDRYSSVGFCGMSAAPTAAKAMLHKWEEPCIAYKNGAGTVFFSGCSLKCVYCQNRQISTENFGSEITDKRLADIFLELQEQGADNIELVTATHFIPDVLSALDAVKSRLNIPVVYNTGGYERAEIIRLLDGYVDVYLPDIKYFSADISARLSDAPDYFERAAEAVTEMLRQTGGLVYNADGGLTKGVVIRHLVLPGCRHDSMAILDWIAANTTPENALISLMSQYTPPTADDVPDLAENFRDLTRRITKMEYNSVVNHALELGLNGFMQEKSSAVKDYLPVFDLSGIV